jgi:transposase
VSTYARQEHRKDGGRAAQPIVRSRGGFSTKINVSVDALGSPVRFRLTAGHRDDITQVEALVVDYECEYVIADRAYDADDFVQLVISSVAVPVIPPPSNRKDLRGYGEYLYQERHLAECFINKIEPYRRIFSDFEKLDSRYLGFLCFAGTLIWPG